MSKGRLIFVAVICGMCCLIFLLAVQAQPSVSALPELINEAIENNPQIQAAYNSWQAEIQKSKYAGDLPDPVVSYTYFGESVETKVGPQETKYGFSQKLPFPGKLHLKTKSQSKQAEMFQQQYEAVKRKVIRDVKFAYYDLFWVDRASQITEEEKTILETLEKVTQEKYGSNLSPQQDVLKVQVELSNIIDKLLFLKQNRKSLVAKMNSLLQRSREQTLDVADAIEPGKFAYSLDELRVMADNASQQLQAANLGVEKAEYEKSLANMEYLPDFTFGYEYIKVGNGTTSMANDGEDAWMGTVAVSLPIWFGKTSSQVEEKKARLKAAQTNYLDAENNLKYEVEDLYFKTTTYKEIIALYQTALIPQTEQSFQAAKTAYESGVVDFLNWLDAERTLLNTRLAYYKAIADYEKSVAYLEMIIGQDL